MRRRWAAGRRAAARPAGQPVVLRDGSQVLIRRHVLGQRLGGRQYGQHDRADADLALERQDLEAGGVAQPRRHRQHRPHRGDRYLGHQRLGGRRRPGRAGVHPAVGRPPWQPIASQLVNNTNLNGVAASSARNAWAVGDVLDGTLTRPLALHCT
jgi:hypothetical protein